MFHKAITSFSSEEYCNSNWFPVSLKDTYECFGKEIDPNDVLIRSLDQQGIQRLYKTPVAAEAAAAQKESAQQQAPININNHKKELKKLNHSILIAYLDLLEILVKAPNTQLPLDQQQIDLNSQQQTFKTLRDQKLEDIENLFINMHHLINELRPHQARDNIRCILEMQKRQRLETANKFKTHLFKIGKFVSDDSESACNDLIFIASSWFAQNMYKFNKINKR